jgi:hypothetical protein
VYIVPIYQSDTSALRRVACGGEAKGGRLLVAGADAVDFNTAADVAAENAERR